MEIFRENNNCIKLFDCRYGCACTNPFRSHVGGHLEQQLFGYTLAKKYR